MEKYEKKEEEEEEEEEVTMRVALITSHAPIWRKGIHDDSVSATTGQGGGGGGEGGE